MVLVNEKRAWISIDSAALLALLLTPFAYAVAFMYEAGYRAYFGVPFTLVEATLSSLFRSVFLLGLVALLVLSAYIVTVQTIERSLRGEDTVAAWQCRVV
jgi:hypothetical protein